MSEPVCDALPAPLSLLAELTYRCPLACPYCSNPLDFEQVSDALDASTWGRVFAEASDLGVMHVHLSGGEPASRRDLEQITGHAVSAGLYTNLITSGIGLTEKRLDSLCDAGLDHVQLSVQGHDAAHADEVSGYKGGHKRKLQVAGWITGRNLPLTLNAVFHKRNIASAHAVIELALVLGARRLEIAMVQFNGWAIRNRAQLLPDREEAEALTRLVEQARAEHSGKLVIDYVPADYHATYPKACMGGWARSGIVVDPAGRVMPCHSARTIPGLAFEKVSDWPLADIWRDSAAFNRFRGFDWMPEPCASCNRRTSDFGGCRCQALAIAGDAAVTDPVCIKSPHRMLVDGLIRSEKSSPQAEFVYRGR